MNRSDLTRRGFLSAVGLSAAGAGCLSIPHALSASESSAGKPNVLLIMTDDQGWGDIHSHGNDLIDTPVLDRLAASGARFDRFYVSPVCAPTRASLLTGRYHLRTAVHGVTRGYETMRSEETTLAEILRAAGYRTGCFGKWHNGAHYPQHPNGQGFDEFIGFCAGHWNNYFDATLERNGKPFKAQGYITDALTDYAIEFIRSNRDRPFFCYVPYNAPHSPWQVPDRYFDKYKARGLDDTTACAYAMCENVDDNLGRLLQTLDQLKLAGDTIVLFLTDNGPNSDRYNGDMKGRKGSAHEGGIRVPLFVRWPGRIEPGRVIQPIASHLDLLPTLAHLCGAPLHVEKPLDGKNLASLLEGDGRDWPDRMIFTHWGNRGSARTQRWRAHVQGQKWELYDMIADPGQKNEVGQEHPAVLKKLRAAYERWYKDATKDGFDPIPTSVGCPESPEVVLPGHEAFLMPEAGDGISYVGKSGWANDWVTNWTSVEAYPSWEIDVVREGNYEITLMYTCAEENLGAKIQVEAGGKKIGGIVDRAHDPEPLPSPDRVPRKEVFEKVWAPLNLGIMRLPQGRTQLCVKALTIPGETVMDLKAVHIKRVD
ncbi:MAG: arylsulfatase [Candidatus Omnitrophica bacterium]|nr:arylsulfatase [Candidatus Omnitrophota bacterium]